LPHTKTIKENRAPGPGAYDTSKADLSPNGKYVLSNIHNILTRKFGMTSRKNIGDRN
jgi:hypothetical protein